MQRNVDLIILVKNIITWELTFLVRIYWKDISSCLSVWWYLCILQHLIHTPQCDCPALISWHQLQQGRSHSLNSFVVALFLVDLQYFADLQYFTDQQFLLLQLVPSIYAPCDSDFCSYACNQWHWQYCFHFLKKYINETWTLFISLNSIPEVCAQRFLTHSAYTWFSGFSLDFAQGIIPKE